jgi:Eukaryotic DNA topoisomerase I, catalytic core
VIPLLIIEPKQALAVSTCQMRSCIVMQAKYEKARKLKQYIGGIRCAHSKPISADMVDSLPKLHVCVACLPVRVTALRTCCDATDSCRCFTCACGCCSAQYEKDWLAKDEQKAQIATALYFIDILALRAGHEKDEEEADTVGCCNLKVLKYRLPVMMLTLAECKAWHVGRLGMC